MIRQYLKQAWRLLRENATLSAISIIGTALAICLIMVMVMVHEVRNASYPPETNRDRMLYVKFAGSRLKGEDDSSSSNGPLGYKLSQDAFKALTTPEAVTIVNHYGDKALASEPKGRKMEQFDLMLADEAFWQVFDFSFISGAPFTKADYDAGLKKVVIAEQVARSIFGTTDVVGQTIQLNYVDFEVVGVVRNVSPLATAAYSQIWGPITANEELYDGDNEGINGLFRAYILAKERADFPKIREEAEALRLKFNDAQVKYEAFYRGQPDDHFTFTNRKWANLAPDMDQVVRKMVIVLALLLIVPTINLSTMTSSRMRKRLPELGVRRSFGASKGNLVSQVMWESMLQTFIGAVIGLLLAFVSAYLFKGLLFEQSNILYYSSAEVTISPFALLSPTVVVLTLLFAFVINLLSAMVPAMIVANKPIVEALNAK